MRRLFDRPLSRSEIAKRYRLAHPDKVKISQAKHNAKRYQDPIYRTQAITRAQERYHSKTKEILDKQKLGIRFAGKWIRLSWCPRKGQCSKCNRKVGIEIKQTNLHHVKGYFRIFPWYGVEELCVDCHRKKEGTKAPGHKVTYGGKGLTAAERQAIYKRLYPERVKASKIKYQSKLRGTRLST